MKVVPERAVDFIDDTEIRGRRLVMVSEKLRKPPKKGARHERNRIIGRGNAYCYKEETEYEIVGRG